MATQQLKRRERGVTFTPGAILDTIRDAARGEGEFVTEWTDVLRPDDVFIDGDENLYVAELGYRAGRMPRSMMAPIPEHEPHARVSVFDLDGPVITRFGGDVAALSDGAVQAARRAAISASVLVP